MHHDDVVRLDGLGDEVGDPAVDPIAQPAFGEELLRLLLVARRKARRSSPARRPALERARPRSPPRRRRPPARSRPDTSPASSTRPRAGTAEPALAGTGVASSLACFAPKIRSYPFGSQHARHGGDGTAGYRRPPMSARLRLHDVPGRQVLRPGPAGAREHLALVPARREDRRARPERRRQVDAPADHGRQGRALVRGRRARTRRDRRPARAGAGARPGQGRARNVEDGVRELRDLLDRFNEISATFAEPDADFDTLLAEQAKVQDADRPRRRLGARRQARPRDGRAPPARRATATSRRSRAASGAASRSAGCSCSAPDLLLLDEPTNHLDAESVLWLERFLARLQGHRRRRHARPLLPRQRRRLDPRARPRPRHPVPGQLLRRGSSRSRRGSRIEEKTESARRRTLARELEWVRAEPARAAREGEGAPRRVREAARRGAERQARPRRDPHPARPAARRRRDRRRTACTKGFGDRLLFEDLTFSLPPAGIVGVVGPNGAGKTTLFRMIAGEEQPDDGTLRVGDTVELAYVDQARADLDPANTVWKEISGGHDTIELGKREVNSRQYVSLVQLQGLRPAEARRPTSRAASATASTSRSSCARAATSSSSTSRRTTSTSTRCARSRRRCSTSPAARS